ncbi:ketopantoate reductase family protein [Chromatocurvus halotolerans]|uniref:2-dehydropantoate 2-reductase n=1 Tax=Chromatocurvus halotolerans TaxID=1132028 RepID=A0A4R2KR80_9GAMM|nr:2-dehydropantoate 2-reductase [Chromatocurvus halotolerans]TCO76174.1 ketopantoate reductase [Chromatocurvus halotolerans]
MPSDAALRDWHILGAGAIGTLFAHRLANAGCRVVLLSRGDAEARRTLTLDSGGLTRQHTFPMSPPGDPTPIPRLLVSTKAAAVDPAIHSICHRLQAHSTVLVLANGMGFASDLPLGLTAFRGTTTDGAWRHPAGHTVQAGSGTTRIGLPGVAMAPPDWFRDSWGRLRDCQWDNAVETTLWRKLAINCVINPLTAAYRCRNGELASATYRPLLTTLCSEVSAACRAAGRDSVASSLREDVLAVIHSTAQNRSSMLQDVLGGRPTEIDFINGYLIGHPAVTGLELPLNRRLIRAITAGQQLEDTWP